MQSTSIALRREAFIAAQLRSSLQIDPFKASQRSHRHPWLTGKTGDGYRQVEDRVNR
jgi:hypothetical protein